MIFSPMHTEPQIIRKNARWLPETQYTYRKSPTRTVTVINKTRKIEYPFETEIVTKPDQLIPAPCKKISCSNCRDGIIKRRHNTIVQLVNQYGLKYHTILTFPGNDLRKTMSLAEAYNLFKHEKYKLDKRINYAVEKLNQGKPLRTKNDFLKKETHTFHGNTEIIDQHQLPPQFLQIAMLRAQSGKHKYATDEFQDNLRGFPHYHMLTNANINTKWIEEITQKNEFKIGFSFVRENQSIENYLANDYYYDAEWYIPLGHRHISTSRGITLDLSTVPLHQSKYYNTQDLDVIESDLSKRGYHVPIENYLNQFINIKNEEESCQ